MLTTIPARRTSRATSAMLMRDNGSPRLAGRARVKLAERPSERLRRHFPRPRAKRGRSLRLQFLEELQDLRLDGDVEGGGRFVRDQEVRLVGQRHGDHDPLPLATADRTNNRSKPDGCEVRLTDGALGGSLQRRPLSPLRMWRWTLETDRSRATAVTWVAVAAWRQAVVFYGSRSWYRAPGCSVLSGGALGLAVVAASRTRMCSRIVAMTSGFSMQAMTRSVPPHLRLPERATGRRARRRRPRGCGPPGPDWPR